MNVIAGGQENYTSGICRVGITSVDSIYYLPMSDFEITAHYLRL